MDYGDTETSSSSTQISSLINPKVWNYGEAGYDHTRIFRVYSNYKPPRASSLVNGRMVRGMFDNWQLSGIYTAQSGAPTGVSHAYSPTVDIAGSSTDRGRVIIVGDATLPKSQRSINEAFNTAAIAAPSPAMCTNANPPFLCWGNANKDVFRGPSINFDMSIFKNMPFGERWHAQLRLEAYNVFNHTQFTTVNPSATFNAAGAKTNGTFGPYTAAANARNLQLALRIAF
jgi:hypothetical protein